MGEGWSRRSTPPRSIAPPEPSSGPPGQLLPEGEGTSTSKAHDMNSTTDVITLEGIRKIFQTDEVETHALSDVHLTIARGEYVSISGPSGCGKTTLLSILG